MRVRVRFTVLWVLLLLAITASPVLSPVAYAQDKTLVWQRFDVDIEVMHDGTFDVAEHQAIRFTSGTFTGGYRNIPINNFDYIDDWAIKDDDGNVYSLSNSGSEDPYTFTVDEDSGQYVINWYFPPTANTTHTYTLSYRVHGGLRFYDKGDQVWWKAIYADHSFPILDGKVRVIVPNGATIQQWSAYINDADARGSVTATLLEGNQAIVYELQRRLDAGEGLEVRVEFTPGVVDGVAPAWQAAADPRVAEIASQVGFANKSLQGTYAAISIAPNVGVIGLCDMDGDGAFDCDFTVNVPGDNNDRMVLPMTSTGIYTLTAAGLGIAQEEQEAPDGTTSSIENLFAVTGAKAVGHDLLATQLDRFSPGDNGATDHSVLKRLPDLGNVEGGFSNASVVGAYAMSAPIGPGIAGICDMDGAGSYTCDLAVTAPGENGEIEKLVLANTGSYTVTSSGMGSVHYIIPMPDGNTLEGDDDFVISAAETDGPYVVATELTDLGRDPADEAGALSVSVLRRLPELAGGQTMTDTKSISSSMMGGQ